MRMIIKKVMPLCAAAVALLVSGCVYVPGHTRSYLYRIDVSANGLPTSFEQYFECYQQSDLNEADGSFHRKWYRKGGGVTAGAVGPGLTLLFNVQGHCGDAAEELPRTALLAVGAPALERFYEISAELDQPDVAIQRVTVTPVQGAVKPLGPTPASVALKKTLMQTERHFHRVSIESLAEDVWATTDASRAYFARLQAPVAASADRGQQASDDPSWVSFPYQRERKYKLRPQGPIPPELLPGLTYRDGVFYLPDSIARPGPIWYAVPAHVGADIAVVDYKGLRVEVKTLQEIYDPQTRSIVQLMRGPMLAPWGPPDDVDVLVGPAPDQ